MTIELREDKAAELFLRALGCAPTKRRWWQFWRRDRGPYTHTFTPAREHEDTVIDSTI